MEQVPPGYAYIRLKKVEIHVFQREPKTIKKGISDVHTLAVSRIDIRGYYYVRTLFEIGTIIFVFPEMRLKLT